MMISINNVTPTDNVDCPNFGFKNLQELMGGFGKNNQSVSGKSCTGCPKLILSDGMLTCKYLLMLADNSDFNGDTKGGL